jgi:hypothetical protein
MPASVVKVGAVPFSFSFMNQSGFAAKPIITLLILGGWGVRCRACQQQRYASIDQPGSAYQHQREPTGGPGLRLVEREVQSRWTGGGERTPGGGERNLEQWRKEATESCSKSGGGGAHSKSTFFARRAMLALSVKGQSPIEPSFSP